MIAVIAVLFSVIFSAFSILFLHVSGRSIRFPMQTIRILSLSASLAMSSIHFSRRRKRYPTSSGDRFLILSSESAQKLANGIPSFFVSRMIFFAFSYPRLCHSKVGSHRSFDHVRFPSMIYPICCIESSLNF